ncbi:DUF2190 family protein [Comamonas sp.]|uniref:DUF2190 family protein n=1 Tax=Comamonas sp. TaxID=34028 RepID=UPI0012C56F83|nr:DUF2190 family protein [Comamonas sp.]MPS93361.1 DUF2190 family protein [Comamonas sp.]
MRNSVQPGNVIEVAAADAAVVPGQVVVIGAILAVANGSAAAGESYNATRGGVFELPKVGGAAFTQGQPLYWDASAGAFAGTGAPAAGDITGAAVAWGDAVSGATSALVLLPGLLGTVVA